MKWTPVGGVRDRDHMPTKEQIERARVAILEMPRAKQLDRSLKGRTVVVMGDSASMLDLPYRELSKFAIIGCNRTLREMSNKDTFWPTHLMTADREPYCQERDSGRLGEFVKGGGIVLGSDSLFQPEVFLRGPYTYKINRHTKKKNPSERWCDRRAQPTPDFKMYVYRIGTGGRTNAQARIVCNKRVPLLNYKTFGEPVESCLNIAGSLLQAACIMKAKRIVTIGVDLTGPHKYPGASESGASPQNKSMPYTLACFSQAREEFKRRGIKVYNLSQFKNDRFAKVFPPVPWKVFAREVL